MKLKSTMGQWKARKMKKGQRASRNTGRSKGIVATTLAKYMCRSGRSYKHPLYEQTMSSIGQRKQKG